MNNRLVFDNFRAMGTDVSVEIVVAQEQEQQAQEALQKAKDIFAENEKIFSRFDRGSELSKINSSLGKEIFVSEKMLAVLELCLKFHTISEGYFEPRVIGMLEKIGYDKDFKTHDLNTQEAKGIQAEKFETDLRDDVILDVTQKTVLLHKRIDTTGIAKGYTVDEVAQYLKKAGFQNFVVDAGGDMFAHGLNSDGENWTIGVEGAPEDKVVLKLQHEGIATSGISRKRWQLGDKKVHHLINPKDPTSFSYDIKTVTVIDAQTVEADGRAKTLVLMGKEKGLQFADKHKIKALFLDYRGTVWLSKAIKENIVV